MAREQRSVLIIVENLPVPRDRRVWLEARTLAAAGYQVSVICPATKAWPKRHEVIDGIHIYRHPLPPEGEGAVGYALEYATALFWEFILSFRVLFTRGFDVIQACNPPETMFIIGLFFKIFAGKRFIFDHHDLSPELYEAKFGRKDFFLKLLLAFERWTFKTADVSIATNESFKKIAIERGGKAPDEVYVVRSGPDLARLKIQEPEIALKQGRRFMIGYLGVMNNQDGVEYVLEAMRHIVHEKGRTDVHAALLGDGPELKNLKELAVKMGIADYVTFTGWADDKAIMRYLNTTDVCVSPDPYNSFNDKCTMNKIVEYMALGRPIVTFDLTEGRVSAGEAAVYAKNNDPVAMAEAVLELLADPERRARMGEYGHRRAERELSWQHSAPILLAAYEAVFTGQADRAKAIRTEAPDEAT
jgi:glycosyltransferase involved in cell wall biosynthesis